jgi:hypothetical protein
VLKVITRPTALRAVGKNCFQNWITLRNASRLLLGYYCKLVLESADENVYLREKERNTRLKK